MPNRDFRDIWANEQWPNAFGTSKNQKSWLSFHRFVYMKCWCCFTYFWRDKDAKVFFLYIYIFLFSAINIIQYITYKMHISFNTLMMNLSTYTATFTLPKEYACFEYDTVEIVKQVMKHSPNKWTALKVTCYIMLYTHALVQENGVSFSYLPTFLMKSVIPDQFYLFLWPKLLLAESSNFHLVQNGNDSYCWCT